MFWVPCVSDSQSWLCFRIFWEDLRNRIQILRSYPAKFRFSWIRRGSRPGNRNALKALKLILKGSHGCESSFSTLLSLLWPQWPESGEGQWYHSRKFELSASETLPSFDSLLMTSLKIVIPMSAMKFTFWKGNRVWTLPHWRSSCRRSWFSNMSLGPVADTPRICFMQRDEFLSVKLIGWASKEIWL